MAQYLAQIISVRSDSGGTSEKKFINVLEFTIICIHNLKSYIFVFLYLGEPGLPAPPFVLNRYKGDSGEPGLDGQPGRIGLPGPKGNNQIGNWCRRIFKKNIP